MSFFDHWYVAVGIIWLIGCALAIVFFMGSHREDSRSDDLLEHVLRENERHGR